MSAVIVWFKTDLRLRDNETLVRAIQSGLPIIPVYCVDENQLVETNFGFKKTGIFRTNFLYESLLDLDYNLRKIGSGLIVLNGKPEIEITRFVSEHNVTIVFSKREIAPDELSTESKVKNALSKMNCRLETVCTSNLIHFEDLPFPIQKTPDTFTDFRKSVEKNWIIRNEFDKPNQVISTNIKPLTFQKSEYSNHTVFDSRAAIRFKGGETEAWKRLDHYFFQSNQLVNYKETRNGMIGADYSSKLSAWLSLGCISSKSIYHQIKKYEKDVVANESTYWLIFELLWRDYFRLQMEKYGSKFFQRNGISKKTELTFLENTERLQNWIDGKTGFDFVDANMNELRLTGYVSNRGRQNVASFFCHDLKLDWRIGATYFESQLIDYDVSSNWCNWAYIAGVGNDPRKDRYFNIEKQANDYDKNKTYRNLWLKKI